MSKYTKTLAEILETAYGVSAKDDGSAIANTDVYGGSLVVLHSRNLLNSYDEAMAREDHRLAALLAVEIQKQLLGYNYLFACDDSLELTDKTW